ncbi:hypothetical protein HDU96_001567 [Phlyctochytrium bullatum]|nr:hypothetical protein HDU96_001567 [Phlyctochytrium bullatum]
MRWCRLCAKPDFDADDMKKPTHVGHDTCEQHWTGTSVIRPGSSAVAEREARTWIASLSPAEAGERLMSIGLGPGLVSALEENGIDRANLLTLTDADLAAIGIDELYSREMVLRAVACMTASERQRIERTAATLSVAEALPLYLQ